MALRSSTTSPDVIDAGMAVPVSAPGKHWTTEPGTSRLILFVAGDFAFNLYWQSAMLYLLFYYTEAIHIPIRLASACYAIALAWDGVTSLAIGIAIRRVLSRRFTYSWLLAIAALPLGISFAAAYTPPPSRGLSGMAWVLAGHLVFRTLYALANIPYLAMSARISARPRRRAAVAGGRMIAGASAAVAVALGTLPLGHRLAGPDQSAAFAAAAAAFAVVASTILLLVALTFTDALPPSRPATCFPVRVTWTVWRNPAFRWFAAATVLMIVPISVLDRTVLYYFSYSLGDPTRGRLTLGAMMAVSGAAVPLWLALSRAIGLRLVWFVAIALCLADLIVFIVVDPVGTAAVQVFLIVLQGGAIGLSFAMWALLPEAIEAGRQAGDEDAEAVAYGWLAMLQRLAIGLGALILGMGFGAGGLRTGGAWLRLSLTGVPLALLTLSGLLMLLNPYARISSNRPDIPSA